MIHMTDEQKVAHLRELRRKVNKPRVRKLVEALRSGEFRQGFERLMFVDERMCCLGVACTLAAREDDRIKRWKYEETSSYYVFGTHGDYSSGVLPKIVLEYYGFDDSPEVLTTEGNFTTAIYLNDELKLDFNAIADAFERTYLVEEDDAGEESVGG